MSKKILASFISVLLFLSTNSSVMAEDTNVNHDDIILQQAIAMNTQLSSQNCEQFDIVPLNQISSLSVSTEISSNKAIQSIEYENNLVKVTTILPYKILPNGELISSFDYEIPQTRGSGPVVVEFVDIAVTINAYYDHYFSFENVANFYRHIGVDAYWNSDNSTVSVQQMNVIYESAGEVYSYPRCMTESLSSTLISDNYSCISRIEKSNPIKGTCYENLNNFMPTNSALLCTHPFEHGGVVSLELSYKRNGQNYSKEDSYSVYTS